jgi:hypothetical protein
MQTTSVASLSSVWFAGAYNGLAWHQTSHRKRFDLPWATQVWSARLTGWSAARWRSPPSGCPSPADAAARSGASGTWTLSRCRCSARQQNFPILDTGVGRNENYCIRLYTYRLLHRDRCMSANCYFCVQRRFCLSYWIVYTIKESLSFTSYKLFWKVLV